MQIIKLFGIQTIGGSIAIRDDVIMKDNLIIEKLLNDLDVSYHVVTISGNQNITGTLTHLLLLLTYFPIFVPFDALMHGQYILEHRPF